MLKSVNSLNLKLTARPTEARVRKLSRLYTFTDRSDNIQELKLPP